MDKQKLILLVVPSPYPNPVDLTPQLKEHGLGSGWRIQQISSMPVGNSSSVGVAVVLASTEEGDSEELPPAQVW